MSNPDGRIGTLLGESQTSSFNEISYIVRAILTGRAHVVVVRVTAVNPPEQGETLRSKGTVDVQPMVNQLDADGSPRAHGVINGLPWWTLQAGTSAVVLKPVVGDRGLCVVCDRDISSVKSTRENGNPGSYRQSSMADGVYLGGLLNDDPDQWIEMNDEGIVIHSPTLIKLEAPTIRLEAGELIAMVAPTVTIDAEDATTVTTGQLTVNGPSQFNGDVSVNGGLSASGTITATTDVIGGGISLKNHRHQAQGATAITTPPLP